MKFTRYLQNVNIHQAWRVVVYATPVIVYNIIKKAQEGGD